jgi:tetratricopeptide (TPR) repeat protein
MGVALQYRAFIAYTHADVGWAKWLHGWLESFRGDKDLIWRDATGTLHRTLRPLYRDPGDVTVGQTPTQQTLAALEASRALIVICSPASAQSSYVAEQIRLFRSRHPERPVIPLIVDGKPGHPELECFPPTLKFRLDPQGEIIEEPSEIQAADTREEADGEALALAKIVAGILGASADEVFRRSERGFRSVKREGRRQANIIRLKHGIKLGMKAGFVVAFMGLIVLTSVWVDFDYQRRQQLAAIDALIAKYGAVNTTGTSGPERGPNVAEAISSISDAPTTLEPRHARALELLGAGQYQQAEHLLLSAAEEKARLGANAKATAAALRNLAPVAAISNHDKAREYYAEAAALDPDNVEGAFWNGWFQAKAGSLNEAETAYQRVINMARAKEDDWALYWARLGLGDIRLSRGDLSPAFAAYQAASEMADRLAKAGDPDSAVGPNDLPVAYIKLGDVLMAQGNLVEALTSYQKGLAIIERLTKANPDNTDWQRDLVAIYGRRGETLIRQGDVTLALDVLSHGRAVATRLKELFPDNDQLSHQLASFDSDIAKLQLQEATNTEAIQAPQATGDGQ